MKIAYLTFYNALDLNQWSGLGYYIHKALEASGATVTLIGSEHFKIPVKSRVKERFSRIRKGNKYLTDLDPEIVRTNSRALEKKIPGDADLIFSPGTRPLAFLETDKPCFFYTDATFPGMMDYYDKYSGLSEKTSESGMLIDQYAIEKSIGCFYSSEWAAQSALNHYQVSKQKIKVIPFGANIMNSPGFSEVKRTVESGKGERTITLVFMGVDWYRKGADFAIKTAGLVQEKGMGVKLHLIGFRRTGDRNIPPYVLNHGFIDKNDPASYKRIENLFLESHFLLGPSRQEAFGLMYAEANAYGVPALAFDTGGVSSVIRDGINGKLFPASATPEDFADFIIQTVNNRSRYKAMAWNAFGEYRNRLNWDVAGKSLVTGIEQFTSGKY